MEKRIIALMALSVLALAASSEADPSAGVEISPYIDDGITTIEKAAPEEIFLGEVLPISIIIKNGFNGETVLDILEDFGGAEIIDAGAFKEMNPGNDTRVSGDEYYRAVVRVPANSKATVTYKIKPDSLGELTIPRTLIRSPLGQTETNPIVVKVRCNQNSVCETVIGENSFNCPKDCKPDKPDNLCNLARDKVCDPDCLQGADPDCYVPTTTQTTSTPTTSMPINRCGNNACDSPGENYAACPGDCPSGSSDGFCDKKGDGRCDPDCIGGEDVDCARSNSWLIIIAFILAIGFIAAVAYKKKWLRPGE